MTQYRKLDVNCNYYLKIYSSLTDNVGIAFDNLIVSTIDADNYGNRLKIQRRMYYLRSTLINLHCSVTESIYKR